LLEAQTSANQRYLPFCLSLHWTPSLLLLAAGVAAGAVVVAVAFGAVAVTGAFTGSLTAAVSVRFGCVTAFTSGAFTTA
jgi:hypothetical protein